jgi:hypothetical protein
MDNDILEFLPTKLKERSQTISRDDVEDFNETFEFLRNKIIDYIDTLEGNISPAMFLKVFIDLAALMANSVQFAGEDKNNIDSTHKFMKILSIKDFNYKFELYQRNLDENI